MEKEKIIEKACEWLMKNLKEDQYTVESNPFWRDKRQFIEELKSYLEKED